MVESSSECWLGNRSAISRSLARKNIMKEDERRHGALLDASSYPPETAPPSFHRRAVCGKCGSKRVDVRPN
jgi:hypothetical protein